MTVNMWSCPWSYCKSLCKFWYLQFCIFIFQRHVLMPNLVPYLQFSTSMEPWSPFPSNLYRRHLVRAVCSFSWEPSQCSKQSSTCCASKKLLIWQIKKRRNYIGPSINRIPKNRIKKHWKWSILEFAWSNRNPSQQKFPITKLITS